MILFSIDIGIVNLAYCMLDVQDTIVNILHWEVISLVPPNTLVKNISLIDIGRTMQIEFDLRMSEQWKDLSIDHIIIENQIGNKAIRMKTLQGMVTQYFIQKNTPNIVYWSACNKLKCFLKNNEKTTYYQRKKLGIQITNNILECYFIDWSAYFKSHKKKDDLADSLLQGIHYILKSNLTHIFNNAENLKL